MTFQEWGNDEHVKKLVMLVLALAALALVAYAYSTFKESQYVGGMQNTISVTGTGELFVRPDIATFTFSVLAEERDAVSAQEISAEAISDIISFLDERGIDEKDIKTIAYNLSPKYEYVTAPCNLASGFCPPGKQNLVGYTVNQTIEVKVRDTSKAGGLISGVGGLGATNVSNLQFTVDDEEKLQAEARGAAIEDARAKAAVLADNLDVRLVRLVNYYEQQVGPYPMLERGFGGVQPMAADIAVEIPTGENKVTSTVTLVYEIR